MAKRQVDLLQGTLDVVVLKSLALGPLHGLNVSNRIAAGRRQFDAETQVWQRISLAITTALKAT